MSRKRPRSLSPPSPTGTSPSCAVANTSLSHHEIFRSSPIKDRASTFIAVFSASATATNLQALPEFKTATHRVAAWRKASTQRLLSGSQCLYDAGHDDDGETYGGKRLEKVLVEMNVEGAVVVARWYGGVLLGPVRFAHIENCAREAITKWQRDASRAGENGHAAQRRKVEDDEEQKSVLVKTLRQRDSSVSTLRDLLQEKREKLARETGDGRVVTPQARMKSPAYQAMPLQALQRLEKARDATISWILKEIDKVEEEDLKLEAEKEIIAHPELLNDPAEP